MAPAWLAGLLLYKKVKTPAQRQRMLAITGHPAAPSIADIGSDTSLEIAHRVLRELGVTHGTDGHIDAPSGQKAGSDFEAAVKTDLRQSLSTTASYRTWQIGAEDVKHFEQYKHLGGLEELLADQPTLRVTLGTDYQIKPDVTVGIEDDRGRYLHAVVSCKWTLRSDRAQNVRHEFKPLIASRRGRTPHLIAVTAEPLPTRLASLARGTGEIDAVYHVAFEEMHAAVAASEHPEQQDAWNEIVGQERLRDYRHLAADLTR
ncbi:NgoMIV family type II restriction endonuclease [Phytomonospora endophytica]|uniref:Restriction endonuclease n=1 Tax=Phytomonospora endophytica TaxID=714109 RepID=A0A841FRK7_9ACTN|nr:NgoMIV family type II restriction endonuclease [Phytomonospora endophytica]MBB6036182.1 hypothetical protein [Phytomonospora endophytica]GIG67088.1 hypothetical protein Pen01_33830 [Phytomonospora endophytica]